MELGHNLSSKNILELDNAVFCLGFWIFPVISLVTSPVISLVRVKPGSRKCCGCWSCSCGDHGYCPRHSGTLAHVPAWRRPLSQWRPLPRSGLYISDWALLDDNMIRKLYHCKTCNLSRYLANIDCKLLYICQSFVI